MPTPNSSRWEINLTRRQLVGALAAGAAGLVLGAGWGAWRRAGGRPPGDAADLLRDLPLAAPPRRDPDTGLWELQVARPGLGTLVSVTALHGDLPAGAAALRAALAEAERLEGLLSAYRPATPMWRLNQAGSLEAPPPDLVAVLEQSLAEAARSGGAFDPTVAPVLALYADRARQGRLPAAAELEAARRLIGYGDLAVTAGYVRLGRPGMALTINAAGKGYVIDAMVRRLRAGRVAGALVFIGGDLFALGRRGQRRWRVGVRGADGGVVATLAPEDAGVATSGDYRAAYDPDGRHHHILDPRRGESPPDVRSVTAVAATSAAAGALATAAFALGPDAGRAYLGRHGDGLMLFRSGRRWAADGLPVAE